MNVRKTTFAAEQKEKADFYFAMTPVERLAHHYKMLQKIYGDQLNQPLPPEALIVRKRFVDPNDSH